jgi:SAM-dependent methyltransferase
MSEQSQDQQSHGVSNGSVEQQRQLAQVRLLVAQLDTSLWAHAALTGALEAGVLDLLLQPMSVADLAAQTDLDRELLERMLDVLLAVGLMRRESDTYTVVEGLALLLRAPVAREAFFMGLRSQSLQSLAFVQRARNHTLTPGWRFADPTILHAQGAGGNLLVQIIAEQLVPMLPGLRERLSAPTAAFLDVGVGVGQIAIAMCRRFPQLRVVGIDIQHVSLEQAKRAVAKARLASRIKLRRQGVEQLSDRDAFDLVWLPQPFVTGEAFARGLRTVYEALRPGGWLLLGSIARDGSDVSAAVSRLIDALWGGDARTAEQVAELARQAGYASVQILPTLPGEPITGQVAQRPM